MPVMIPAAGTSSPYMPVRRELAELEERRARDRAAAPAARAAAACRAPHAWPARPLRRPATARATCARRSATTAAICAAFCRKASLRVFRRVSRTLMAGAASPIASTAWPAPPSNGTFFLGRTRGRMALNIKSAETDRLARELAALTGESITEAVTRALEQRLEDQRAAEGDVARAAGAGGSARRAVRPRWRAIRCSDDSAQPTSCSATTMTAPSTDVVVDTLGHRCDSRATSPKRGHSDRRSRGIRKLRHVRVHPVRVPDGAASARFGAGWRRPSSTSFCG